MDIEKLIEQYRQAADKWEKRHPVTDTFDLRVQDALRDAATALSTLQAENKRLNKIVCSIPTTPDSGRTVSQYDKEMSMCAYLDDLEAENEKLRAELERKNEALDFARTKDAEIVRLGTELERVKRENNALWTYIEIVDREYRRYMDRGYIDRLDELKKVWKRGQKED